MRIWNKMALACAMLLVSAVVAVPALAWEELAETEGYQDQDAVASTISEAPDVPDQELVEEQEDWDSDDSSEELFPDESGNVELDVVDEESDADSEAIDLVTTSESLALANNVWQKPNIVINKGETLRATFSVTEYSTGMIKVKATSGSGEVTLNRNGVLVDTWSFTSSDTGTYGLLCLHPGSYSIVIKSKQNGTNIAEVGYRAVTASDYDVLELEPNDLNPTSLPSGSLVLGTICSRGRALSNNQMLNMCSDVDTYSFTLSRGSHVYFTLLAPCASYSGSEFCVDLAVAGGHSVNSWGGNNIAKNTVDFTSSKTIDCGVLPEGSYWITVTHAAMLYSSAQDLAKMIYALRVDVPEPESISSATISKIPDQTYTGASICPEPTVTLKGKVLKKGTDYILSWSNNVEAGTAMVFVTGIGNYGGQAYSKFKIVKPTPSSIKLKENEVINPNISLNRGEQLHATFTLKEDCFAGVVVTASCGGENWPTVALIHNGNEVFSWRAMSSENWINHPLPLHAGSYEIVVTSKAVGTKVTSLGFGTTSQKLEPGDALEWEQNGVMGSSTPIALGQKCYGSINGTSTYGGTASDVDNYRFTLNKETDLAVSLTTHMPELNNHTLNLQILDSNNTVVQNGKTQQKLEWGSDTYGSTTSTPFPSTDGGIMRLGTLPAGSYVLRLQGNSDSLSGDDNSKLIYGLLLSETDEPSLAGEWQRLAGNDRYETMAAISAKGFSEKSAVAVVASGENFPDALVASALAGYWSCPVLLTNRNSLSSRASSELARLGVSSAIIMGGEAAVSPSVEQRIQGRGISTTRIAGSDRQATSLAVLDSLLDEGVTPDTVVIATGMNFADALSIGPWCYADRVPILLTGRDGKLNANQVGAITKIRGLRRVVIVGGPLAVSEAIKVQLGSDYDYIRIAGNDRYATSAAIAEFELNEGLGMSNVAVATGANFPDALAGAALCGKNNSVLLLSLPTAYGAVALKGTLASHAHEVSCGYVLGGESAVPEYTVNYCRRLTGNN